MTNEEIFILFLKERNLLDAYKAYMLPYNFLYPEYHRSVKDAFKYQRFWTSTPTVRFNEWLHADIAWVRLCKYFKLTGNFNRTEALQIDKII